MGATIGRSDLEKSVGREDASGFLTVTGFVARRASKPVFTPLEKSATPTYAVAVDSRGEIRIAKAGHDEAGAATAARISAMRHAGATVFLAKKAGSGEGGDVFEILGSFKRR